MVEERSIAALALDRVLKRDAGPFAVAHPMLEHEGGRCRIADRAAMRSAVRQGVHAIVAVLEIEQEIEIAVGIVQDREVDEAPALIAHQQVIGIFFS